MRKIKFRVFDKAVKKMHIVGEDIHDSLTCFDGIVKYYNLQNGDGSGDDGDYVLMQYTGLRDKNGREIYELDIVKAVSQGSHAVCTVKWGQGRVGFFLHAPGICWNLSGGGKDYDQETVEVIGNIYENPELLE